MADWFNDDLSDYIDKKEEIIVDTRKNPSVCRFSSVFDGLFISLFITIFSIIITGMTGENDLNIGSHVFVVAVGFPLFTWLTYISELSTRYVLTNSGIYKITGLIFKSFKFVAYNQITDVEMSIGLLERMFGAGSVGVGTSSGNVAGAISDGNGEIYSKNELDIDSVDNYKMIREIIIKNRKD